MTDAPKHALAAESQFVSACLTDAEFARAFHEIAVSGLSNVKAIDWLAPFARDYVKKYGVAPAEDVLPYAEAAVRACELPPEALGFFAQAAKQKVRNSAALLERARKHYHLLARQRHADKVAAACMSDDEDGIAEADMELKAHKAGVVRWGDGTDVCDKSDLPAMFESLPRPIVRLPGYVGLLLNRRLTRDALVIGVASAKIGKTATMARIAFEAAIQGNKVLYVTIGDDKEPRIKARVYSCFSSRPVVGEYEDNERVVAPVVVCKRGARGECSRCEGTELAPFPADKVFAETEPEELLAKYPDFVPCRKCWQHGQAIDKDFDPMIWWTFDDSPPLTLDEASDKADEMNVLMREGSLGIVYRPKRTLTYEALEDMLGRRADKAGRADDVVVIDYPDMMKLPPGREDHEQMRVLWEELRNMSTERDNLTLAVTQANRTGGVVETQTMETVGRTKTAIDNSTCAFSLNQTAAERAMGVMRVSIMAARNFKFAPEHQALCCSWLHVQDPFAESFHVYRKIKEIKER